MGRADIRGAGDWIHRLELDVGQAEPTAQNFATVGSRDDTRLDSCWITDASFSVRRASIAVQSHIRRL